METLTADSEGKRKDMCHVLRKVDELEETLNVEEPRYPRVKSMEWTDEKHSLYLKSMEASFVDHLYGSLDLLGLNSQNHSFSRPKSSRQKHSNPSGQYKVFQDGCWTKIDFMKDEPWQNKTNESGAAVFASPWIKHYKSRGKHQSKVTSDLQGSVKQNKTPVSDDKDCDGSITEVMDQNFVDEDEGKTSSNSSREHSTKRTKISLGAGTSNDQVVPIGVFQASAHNIDDDDDTNHFDQE